MISKPLVLAILNLAAYLLNSLETFGYGPFSSRFSADQNNATISDKYQTIITPFGAAFSIWGLIFLMQAIFCVVCLLSDEYRLHPLVVDGVAYWYIIVCLAQTAWSPAFAYEKMPLAATFMGCILLPLIIIVVKQHRMRNNSSRTTMENGKKFYWLLQFPFELHLGWIMAAFVLNVNIVLVSLQSSNTVQVIAAAVSLGVLACASILCLFKAQRPLYTIPAVIAWASFFIYIGLNNPKASIVDSFSSSEMNGFRYASIILFVILIVLIAFKWWTQKRKFIVQLWKNMLLLLT